MLPPSWRRHGAAPCRGITARRKLKPFNRFRPLVLRAFVSRDCTVLLVFYLAVALASARLGSAKGDPAVQGINLHPIEHAGRHSFHRCRPANRWPHWCMEAPAPSGMSTNRHTASGQALPAGLRPSSGRSRQHDCGQWQRQRQRRGCTRRHSHPTQHNPSRAHNKAVLLPTDDCRHTQSSGGGRDAHFCTVSSRCALPPC